MSATLRVFVQKEIEDERGMQRATGTLGLLAELDADGSKYKRLGIAPTSDENSIANRKVIINQSVVIVNFAAPKHPIIIRQTDGNTWRIWISP